MRSNTLPESIWPSQTWVMRLAGNAARVPGRHAARVGVERSLAVEVHAVRDANIDLCQDKHIIYLCI